MTPSNNPSAAPATQNQVGMSPAQNGDPSAAEKAADGKGGVLEDDSLATKIKHHAGRAGDNSGESKPPARDIFFNMLTPARDVVFNMLTPARDVVFKILTPARAAFALFTVLALWLAADRPERTVWTFSVIVCCYFALWTIYLTAAIRARTVLFSISYIMLLAVAVTHLSSAAGIFFMLLDTAYTAGLLGYALAEYRQRRGMELSAEAVPSLGEEQLKEDRYAVTVFSFYSTIASLACAMGAAWLILRYTDDTYFLVVGLSLLIHLPMFFWTCLVTFNRLRLALVGSDLMVFMYWLSILLFLPDFLLTYLFGSTIGMLVHPIGVMALAGLLGYSLGVYARYKHLKNTLEGKKID